MVTIGLTIFDMGSDILLAVNYANTGKDDWWFALPLLFFLVPFIFLLLMTFLAWIADDDFKGSFKNGFPYWKQFECTFESGPQLILQLYIMSFPNMDINKDQNTESSTLRTINVTLNNKPHWTGETQFTNVITTYRNGTDFTNEKEDDNDIKDAITFALQVLVIITALLSISWGAVRLKRSRDQDDDGEDEEVYWGALDYICDMTWNVLCISSRVITLALFASSEKYWFAGIMTAHIAIALVIYLYLTYKIEYYEVIFEMVLISVPCTISAIFNISLTYVPRLRTYKIYLCYWIMILIENTILISIWYTQTSDDSLWYHTPAIVYVLTAYSMSFFIKTHQTYQRKWCRMGYLNKNQPVSEWIC